MSVVIVAKLDKESVEYKNAKKMFNNITIKVRKDLKK